MDTIENIKIKSGFYNGYHPSNGYEIVLLYKKGGNVCGWGDFYILPNLEKKQSKQCVHNGPGIRKNAARIVDRFEKKQYHRAFKANAAAFVPDDTVTVQDYTASVSDRTALVHDRTAPVHDNTGLVHDRKAPVHDRTASVQDNTRLEYDRTAPVQNSTTLVSDDIDFVAGALILMRYRIINVKSILNDKEENGH